MLTSYEIGSVAKIILERRRSQASVVQGGKPALAFT
jgi:hypothetical protein